MNSLADEALTVVANASSEGNGAILADCGLTILIGLVVVFAMLLLLTAVFKLFGSIMSRIAPEEVPEEAPKAAPVAAPIVGNTAPVSTEPEIQNGIPDETVAAISAAVAAVAPAGVQYAVKDIRQVKEGEEK